MGSGITLKTSEGNAERIVRVLLFLLLAMLPLFWSGSYALGLFTLMAVYGVLLVGLDVTVGYLGQVNLAQAALFGLGAYGSALSIQSGASLPLALLAGIISALIPGAVLALPSLKLEGPQFALSTLSFAALTVIVLNEAEPITNGALGLSIIRPELFGFRLDATRFYWLCLVALALAWELSRQLLSSRFGLSIVAIRDSATAADALGIGVLRHKVLAFAWGSALAGLAGALHGMNFEYLQPASFGYELMVMLLLGVVFGGRRSQWGAFIGALVVALLPNLLSSRTIFSILVSLGCLFTFIPFFRTILSRSRPSFRQIAPAAAMALAVLLAVFSRELEDWRKGIFALFLFAAVVGFPDGIAGVTARYLRRFLLFAPMPLPEAKAVMQPLSGMTGASARITTLSKAFGGVKAVDQVTLDIERDETLGLIGPNGSGKTTLINLLTGLYTPDGGRIEIAGARPSPGSPGSAHAAGAARTFQNLQPFYGLTLLEAVYVCLKKGGLPEAMGWLRLVSLDDKASVLCSAISYGDLRFLEIARALASGPRLLLLDEPAAGMSKPDIARLVSLIVSIRKSGLPVLLIEHHQDVVAELCDRVAVMDGGRLIALGTPAEVRSNPRVIEAYLGADETPAYAQPPVMAGKEVPSC